MLRFFKNALFFTQFTYILHRSVGLGIVHILTGTVTQRYLFSVLYSLCNNKNIYFSEKINPKRSISTFWTIGPYNCFLFFLPEILVFIFSDNQMKAWNIYLFFIKWKWNPFIFWQTNRGFLFKLIHGRKIVRIFL